MKHFKYIALTALAFSIFAVNAQAGWVAGFVGYSEIDVPPAADGLVNFGVWENVSGDWTTDTNLSGSTLSATESTISPFDGNTTADTGAAFVYFYQLVNTNPSGGSNSALAALRIPFAPSQITGAGYLADTVFNDAGGNVGPSGNEFLNGTGNTGGSGVPDTPGDSVPSFFSDGDGVTLVSGGGTAAVTPVLEALTESLELNFRGLNLVTVGDFSTILFITATIGPRIAVARITDSGFTSSLDVAAPVPAPAGLVLLLTGLPGLAGFGWYQRRRKKNVTAS